MRIPMEVKQSIRAQATKLRIRWLTKRCFLEGTMEGANDGLLLPIAFRERIAEDVCFMMFVSLRFMAEMVDVGR